MNKTKLQKIVDNSTSFSDVLKQLGKSNSGTAVKLLKQTLEDLGIKYHFLYECNIKPQKSLLEILTVNSSYQSSRLLKRLLKEGLKKNECENSNCPCKNGQWLGKSITYQLHHINGNHSDNRLENLQVLCPNCHTQTETWGNKKAQKNYCLDCGAPISKKSTYCKHCSPKHQNNRSIKNHPSKEQLLELIQNNSFVKIGKLFGVSATTIRKWCKKYGLPYTKKDLKLLFKE